MYTSAVCEACKPKKHILEAMDVTLYATAPLGMKGEFVVCGRIKQNWKANTDLELSCRVRGTGLTCLVSHLICQIVVSAPWCRKRSADTSPVPLDRTFDAGIRNKASICGTLLNFFHRQDQISNRQLFHPALRTN